jgi:hypothetical protein
MVPIVAFYLIDGGQQVPNRYLPDKQVLHFSDSLVKSGVDTILVYYSRCADCEQITDKDANPGTGSIEETTPAYVMWIDNGRCFIFKSDQYFSYKIIECNRALVYPSFDYFGRNKKAIVDQDKIENPTEKVHRQNLVEKGVLFSDYLYLQRVANPRQEFDLINLFVDCGNDTSRLAIERYPAHPNSAGTDSIGCGNSFNTYYNNLLLPRYEWLRLIESSLFTLEVKRVWKKN